MNLRRLHLAAFVISDVGMILVALAFVFKLGLGSVVSLIGVILMAAGVWLTLGWSALKAKETKK